MDISLGTRSPRVRGHAYCYYWCARCVRVCVYVCVYVSLGHTKHDQVMSHAGICHSTHMCVCICVRVSI